tara:strand:+ start:712 stop:1059 length:348 start_codon:yes stop_codon:yes gene_type:complete
MELEYNLHLEPFVFCCLHSNPFKDDDVVMAFKEQEGMTCIVLQTRAEALGIDFEQSWAWIRVETPTALDATGITAHIAALLSKHQIPCNVVAAFHHDHLFVPFQAAKKALEVLNG